jgi:hypothetical protein
MRTQIATLALSLATLASAAPAQVAERSQSAALTETSANTVTVENDRKVAVTIYMEYGDFDRRLGIVPAMQTATLPLPAWAVNGFDQIQLFAHPEGEAEDLATQYFTPKAPARIGMIIPPTGNMSSSSSETMTAVIPPEELADATLTVDNPRATPVTVFAEQGPFDVRLGQVPAGGRVTLLFPKAAMLPDQTIQIFVHPERGFDLASASLHVHRGAHLGLTVPTR